MGNYHIMERINFIKDMIQTHQNHLRKFDSEPTVTGLQQPRFLKPSFHFGTNKRTHTTPVDQIHKSVSGSEVGRRTEQSRSFTLKSEPSNLSVHDSFEAAKPSS